MLYILVGELYPTEIRSFAVGITHGLAYLSAAILLKLYPGMKNAMTMYGLCYFYASMSLLASVWAYLTIPDNRSKSLVEVEKSFESNSTASIKYKLLQDQEIH